MSRLAGLRQGLFAGPALGALVGLLDCLRAALEGGTVLTPRYWLLATAFYAAAWLPLGLLAGLVGGFIFRRGARASVLLAVLGTAAFAYGAWKNIVHLPSFTAPESLTFDAILLAGTAAVFLALYYLPVRVPEPRLRTWCVLVVLPLAVAGLAGLFGSGTNHDEVEVAVAPGERPNVLVYMVDTLRADHLSAYGYERKTSPNFDRLAEKGVLFTQARVASTWTKPSTATILTGLPPSAHGAIEHRQILPDAAVTLAEVLASGGYDTAAFTDNPFVSPEFGFRQGFDDYDYQAPNVFVNGTLLGKALWTLRVISLGGRVVGNRLAADRGSPELCRRLLDWIGRRPAGKPWFAYVHAMEPHAPYDPPAPFRGTFSDPAYIGPDLDRPPPYLGFLPFERAEPLPEDRRRHLVARYDEEILAWDHAFGRLIDDLRKRELLDRTVIVVISDHGEEFYEHGGWTHAQSLYEELVRVPFFIRGPGIAPAVVTDPVRGADLFPTVISLAGLVYAESPPFGIDLAARLAGRGGDRSPPVTSEVTNGGVGAESVVHEGKKLIVTKRGETILVEGFDLVADPKERSPIADPPWRPALERILEAARRMAGLQALDAPETEISPETEEALKGLGY